MGKAVRTGMAVRHIPIRTCVGCRRTTAKRQMVRLVCLPSGGIEVDPTGKKSGRGAYLCANRICWETALKRRSLERALKMNAGLSPENRAALEAYGSDLPLSKVGEGSPSP